MNVFLHPRFEVLLKERPIVLADVGSRGGLRPVWRQALPHLHVVECEADPDYVPPDLGYPTTVLKVGLADKPGQVPFYQTARDAKSSILRPDPAYADRHPNPRGFEIVGESEIEVDTLDSQVEAAGVPYVDFVKVDTQGTELAILRGGENLLRRSVMGVDVEVNFEQRYVDQPLFGQVDAYLRGLGFAIFDLQRHYLKRRVGAAFGGPKGQLSFGKALYFRLPVGIERLLADEDSADARKARVLRCVAVALMYGYADYGYELLQLGADALDADERADAEAAFAAAATASGPRLPDFRGRTRLARQAARLQRILDPPADGVRYSDPHLGNRSSQGSAP